MSEVLARIRVKEEHGIRRFLYPLTCLVELPTGLDYGKLNIATRDNDLDLTRLQLVSPAGQAVPLAVTYISHKDAQGIETGRRFRLDFAISIGPHENHEYQLRPGGAPAPSFTDYLNIRRISNSSMVNTQKHFTIEFAGNFPLQILTRSEPIKSVVYDRIQHLKEGMSITRNGEPLQVRAGTTSLTTNINAYDGISGWIEDEYFWTTQTHITACKSWATVIHQFSSPKPTDDFTFTLPFAVESHILTCDFGVGGGTFGKLQADTAKEIVWRTEFNDAPYAQWFLATAGRMDYVGEVATADEFLPQRWFHIIDSNKALAVAITELPKSCHEMTVSLNIQGDVVINFRLGERVPESVTFGVCYHFLNDIPAVAAATNPQSILLPPKVEVLPA